MRTVSIDQLLALSIIIIVSPILSIPVQNTDGAKNAQVSEITDEVKQLEGLKNSGSQNVAVLKTQSKSISNINGKEKSITHKEEKVEDSKTGQVIADVKQEIVEQTNEGKPETVIKTNVDIPSEGVHKTIINENGKTTAVKNNDQTEENQERPKPEEYYTGIDGVQYSPWDVARYIFRTGDKEGLGLALRQLISEGLMSKVEAESYMEEISLDLDLLMARAEQETRENAWQILNQVQEVEQALAAQDAAFEAVDSESTQNGQSIESLDRSNDENKVADHVASSVGKMLMEKKLSDHPREADDSVSVESLEDLSFLGDVADFDSFLEKLKLADYLGDYYSVKPDDIIYQLSKTMFQQSMTEGNEEATQALRKFSKFLGREVSEKRLSEALEERVLDIMTEAFHDTLYENPEIQVLERLMKQQEKERNSQALANANNKARISHKLTGHEQGLIPKSEAMKLVIKPTKTKADNENEIVKPLQESPKPNPEATQALAHEAEKQEAAAAAAAVITSKKSV